jgi:hypothetical protein
MKTSKLNIEYNYDFYVFVIISSAKPHKFAWELNETLDLNLKKAEDLIFEFIKEGKILITNYIHQTDFSCFRLFKNKSCEFYETTKPFLLPELKEYDYIFQVSGEIQIMEPSVVEQKIRSINIVEYIKGVNIENLKSKENLIF